MRRRGGAKEVTELDQPVDLQWQEVVGLLPFTEGFDERDPSEARQFYSKPLSSVMGAGGSWLENAVIAGRVPDLASIRLALRANQVLALGQLPASVDDSSTNAETVSYYRHQYQELSELIGSFVAELDESQAA
jgi:hypothetical protein